MGLAKQVDIRQADEDTLINQLKTIQEEIYDERAQGILRQIYNQGIDSMSSKQKYIYSKLIEPTRACKFIECIRCFEDVDTESTFEINDNEDHMCNLCWKYLKAEE